MDITVVPAHLLRSYIWQVLKANLPEAWDESNYGGKIPIVPLGEEPELSKYSGPHIVYGYTNEASGPIAARESGSVSFAVYDQNFRRLGRTMNVLKRAFDRYDETARDVNNYTSHIPEFVGIRFGSISLSYLEGGSPEENEGGNMSALMTVRYEYYSTQEVVTSVLP